MTAPENVYEVEIATTPERLWKAITDPSDTEQYWYGAQSISDWKVGSRWVSQSAEGEVFLDGEILEIDPPRRLVHTMIAYFSDEAKAEGSTRVTWEIEPVGDSCCLTLTHDQMREGANNQIYGGWPMILSGLKTWLETGELLTTPGSLMWA
jgi:uncharacterized protein YndB with AHSA1/START domain